MFIEMLCKFVEPFYTHSVTSKVQSRGYLSLFSGKKYIHAYILTTIDMHRL